MNKVSLALLVIPFLLFSCNKKFIGFGKSTLKDSEIEIMELDFEYMSAKAKINYKDNEKSVKAKANIRIKKDSLIWINFSAVGIPGARCLFTKDSVTMLNLVKKEYYVYKYEEFSEKFKFQLDYDIVQDAIIGNLPFDLSPEDEVKSHGAYYEVNKKEGAYDLSTSINKETKKIEKVGITEQNAKSSLNINYRNYKTTGNASFPFKVLVDLTFEGKSGTIYTYIDMEYSRAVLEDKTLKFPFNIPKKYVRR